MLNIEEKVDSDEKLLAIVGKPTKNYLFAEEFNKLVEAVDNNTSNNSNFNKILSVGSISVDEMTNELTIGATVEAMINNVTVSKSTDTIFSITLAGTGLIRKDIFFINSLGNVLIISGDEGAIATTPILPLDSVYITEILVSDLAIGAPEPPLVGDAFTKKKELGTQIFNGSGALVSIPFQPNGATFIKLTNPSLTSISGFDFTLLTSGSEYPYEGKFIFLQNLTGNPVEIKHNDISNIEFPILLKNEVIINIPDKEILFLRFKNVEVEEVLRSWESQGIQEVVDNNPLLTGSTITMDGDTPFVFTREGELIGTIECSTLFGTAYISVRGDDITAYLSGKIMHIVNSTIYREYLFPTDQGNEVQTIATREWVNQESLVATVTVEFDSTLINYFYAPENLRINTITNISGILNVTIEVYNEAYILGHTIAQGVLIKLTSNVIGVVNLNIVYD